MAGAGVADLIVQPSRPVEFLATRRAVESHETFGATKRSRISTSSTKLVCGIGFEKGFRHRRLGGFRHRRLGGVCDDFAFHPAQNVPFFRYYVVSVLIQP